MAWTYHEFGGLLQARADALQRRDNRLLRWFGALLGLAVLCAVLVSPVSSGLAFAGASAAVVGLAALAVYIVASTQRYSRKHGVACANCGVSLLEVAEELDMLDDDGGPLPMSIGCPQCGVEIIAANA